MEETLLKNTSCKYVLKNKLQHEKKLLPSKKTPIMPHTELQYQNDDLPCFEEINSNEINKKQTRTRKKNILIIKDETQTYETLERNSQRMKESLIHQSKVSNSTKLYLLNNLHIPEYSSQVNKKYLKSLINGVQYVKKIHLPDQEQIQAKSKLLYEQESSKKKFLILDLDQTLIKTLQKDTQQESSNLFKIIFRPYVFTFLQVLSQFYEIYVFTAATKSYASAAISKLNKKASKSTSFIKDFLSRNDCLQTRKKKFIKDLRIIKNRQLKDIVIIDNLVESFGFQLSNGIPILEFHGQEKDKELLKLIPFLKELSQVEDVRPIIKKKYNLEALASLQNKDLQNYFESLTQ